MQLKKEVMRDVSPLWSSLIKPRKKPPLDDMQRHTICDSERRENKKAQWQILDLDLTED